MDYLLGLRLIAALSILGLAVLFGSKVLSLDHSVLSQSQKNGKKERCPLPTGNKKKKLKDDFWDKLTRPRS